MEIQRDLFLFQWCRRFPGTEFPVVNFDSVKELERRVVVCKSIIKHLEEKLSQEQFYLFYLQVSITIDKLTSVNLLAAVFKVCRELERENFSIGYANLRCRPIFDLHKFPFYRGISLCFQTTAGAFALNFHTEHRNHYTKMYSLIFFSENSAKD